MVGRGFGGATGLKCQAGGAGPALIGWAGRSSVQVPVRRFRLVLAIAAAGPRSQCLARNDRIRSRLNEAMVKDSKIVSFARPNTRKNFRPMSTNPPLRAALADSATWRRP